MNTNHGANLYDLSNKYGFSINEFLDFSSNINPLGTSILAKQMVIDNIDSVSRYPDPEYMDLKGAISTYCNCLSENIILGSGATELISNFIKTLKPKKALLLTPTYSEYEEQLNKISCHVTKYFYTKGNDRFTCDVDQLIDYINKNTFELIVICNPNNPTGFTFSKEEIEKLLNSVSSFVMVDETYIEFTDTDKYSSTSLIDKHNNLFVIRGTSKFFSTPGIRLGYGLISNEEIKFSLLKNLDLWNINILATIMGEAMFKDSDFISTSYELMTKERNYLLESLNKLNGVVAYKSQGNFILCELTSKTLNSCELREKLIPYKIIIRNCESFEGLDNSFFRVCILAPDSNRLLIDCLQNIL